jgi:5-methylcytosine-specific restriction endonuclease McrBC regulatory subunit McrC
MIFKPSLKTQRERAQLELDDATEAVSVLDSAISCGFLKDKHSLIAQEWIKEYKNDIEICKMFLENHKEKV